MEITVVENNIVIESIVESLSDSIVETVNTVIISVEDELLAIEILEVGPQGVAGAQGPAGAAGTAGPTGPQGPAGNGDLTYIHNQISSSTTWTVAHNLGKFPSVMVIDSGGSVVIGDILYVDDDNLTITFSAAFGGKAYIN